jgi:hypothetical protein
VRLCHFEIGDLYDPVVAYLVLYLLRGVLIGDADIALVYEKSLFFGDIERFVGAVVVPLYGQLQEALALYLHCLHFHKISIIGMGK